MRLRAYLAAGLLAAAAHAAAAQDWTAAWGTALMVPGEKTALAPDAVAHATLRQAMRLSLGGAALRVRISNRHGAEPFVIGAATVGRAAQPGDSRLAGPALPLRFGGKSGVTVAPGADVVSDPLGMATQAGDLLAVSLAVDGAPARQTAHNAAHATQFLAPGDQASRPVLEGAQALTSWYQVEGIEVLPARRTNVLVAIGDSITDGSGAGLDRDERWPDYLQRRLRAAHAPSLAVVNAGIGGNRMLADGNGPRLLDRFAHDALERPGVTHALVLIGVNDLGVQHRSGRDTPEARRALLDALEEGFRRIAAQAHARGVCLIAGTITPYGGSGTYKPDAHNEADRRALNDWLRASPLFDGVADFDAAVRDPAAPDRLQAAFDSGDRLHPSPAGYRAMADAVPLDRLASCGARPATAAHGAIDLAGTWRFALDREDAGVAGHWEARALPDRIRIPGILNAQGYGDAITARTPWVLSLYDKSWNLRADYAAFTTPGQVKVPFLSQPSRHYLGAAWYQRDVEVPPGWRGKRVVLHLERPRWGSSAWIDGRPLGANSSLVAPHEDDAGPLAPGTHRVTVRVDSRVLMAYRPDSHSISDSLGMSWNGIVGKAELRATSPVYIADAQVFPDVATRSVRVKLKVGNGGGKAGAGTVTANGRRFPVRWTADGGSAEFRVQYPQDAPTWDEFHPVLQTLKLRLAGPGVDDARAVSFGFVQVAARGTDILVNGRPVFLRGTHHGGDFPLTGYPPTDVAYWKKIFAINKAWGINHIRFHSFTPPEAAFQAADEVGIYLQPEPGMWNRFEPGSPIEAALYDETERLIRAYGNHPSFLLLSPSNEPSGRWKEVFAKWTARFRAEDPRRLYTNGTGHTEPVVPELDKDVDYLAVQRIGPKPLRNKTGWFGRDFAASLDGIRVPVVGHETGQWVAYPDYSIIDKFTGYLQPGNYEIFRESARRHGVLDRNRDFALASGAWQLACYKEEIEAVLRTRGMSGYQLLDLHDYLGQGTALVGLLDTFWEPKGYATPDAFRRFNGETVPLARLTRPVLAARDTFDVPVEIAHYGARPLRGARPWWRIEDDAGRAVVQGRFATLDIPIGKNIPLGRVETDLARLPAPAHYRLVVGLDGTGIANDWNFWLYPDQVDTAAPAGVLVTHAWPEAEARLAQGGKVLYLPRKADLDWTSPPLADVPVFWNRLMNPGWSRMLGLWVDRAHPALAGFPTFDHMDWQWSDLVAGARAFNLERLPAGLRPIAQPIDDWNRNYRLGAVFEAKVGDGRLVVATFDLENRLDERPAARQLRRSLLDYMAGPRFLPATPVDAAALRASLFDTRVMKKLGAKAGGWPDAANVVDGDPNTYSLVTVKGDVPRPQPVLTIGFAQPVPFDGLVLMPRQNHRDHEGDVREWRIEASDDGTTWRDMARPALQSTFDPQTVRFGQTVTARWLRLTSLSGFGPDRASALADVAVLYAGPALPEEGGELEYKRSRSTSADVDEAGMDDRPRRRAR